MTGRGLIWLASYPKSGNTWVRVILACLRAGGRAPDLAESAQLGRNSAELDWLESILDVPTEDMVPAEHVAMRAEAYRILAGTAQFPLCLKVHDAYDAELFPAEVTAGTILVVRDPRDVAPSWADHMNVSVDVAIERMNLPDFTLSRTEQEHRLQARQRLGTWSANVLSWLDAAPGPKLLLRYEDMLADPAGAVFKVAEFVGLPASPDLVAATVQASSFDSLRAAEAVTGFAERMEHQNRFFRQGQAGAWRNTLSSDQAALLWAAHGPTMSRLGYSERGG